MDPTHKQEYYYNTVSNMSSWTASTAVQNKQKENPGLSPLVMAARPAMQAIGADGIPARR